jgi:hypothetical protein
VDEEWIEEGSWTVAQTRPFETSSPPPIDIRRAVKDDHRQILALFHHQQKDEPVRKNIIPRATYEQIKYKIVA